MKKKLIKVVIPLMIVSIFLSGCRFLLVANGRGDWNINLLNGYSISRINAHSIVLSYKEYTEKPGNEIVIDNYFLTAYQIADEYICAEGIPTKEEFASDEELESPVRNYYLVDTTNGDVVGPFMNHADLNSYCDTSGLTLSENWMQTKENGQ